MSHGAPGEAPSELELAIEAAQPDGAAVGIVEAAGERSGALHGKRVLVPAAEPCGQCELCRRGGAAVCPLARRRDPAATRVRVSSRWVVELGEGLDLPVPAAAAVPGDVTTAYTLYARTNLAPREPVIVTGANAIARFLVEILVARSITPTVVADPVDRAWCEWLAARGAGVARTGDGELAARVTAAVAAQGTGARPWRILAAGEPALAATLAGPRATLTVLATGGAPDIPGALLDREVSVLGVAGPHPDLVVEAAAMCARGQIDLAGGVTTDPADRTRAYVSDVRTSTR